MARIYRTVSHIGGYNGMPQYEIRDRQIYCTVSHVGGYNGMAQFEIRD
jgi:hypothetical protein